MRGHEITPAAARALEAARRRAEEVGRAVSSDDVLAGLLAEDEGRPRLLLAQAGFDAARGWPLAPADGIDVHLLLEDAQRIVSPLSDPGSINSDAVLLALLRRSAGLRGRLEQLGLQFAPLAEAIEPETAVAPIAIDEPLQLGNVTEQVDAARVLDACGNRAREALRVLEDQCRFVLDDAFLSRELKQLRHDLGEVLDSLDPQGKLGLCARDTVRDVGVSIRTRTEGERRSLLDVVQANVKRLQEALRSLEEFGKLHGPQAGQALEALRYRAYTVERMLVLGGAARARLADARLYVLMSASACTASLEWTISEAAAGGVDIVQLREKNLGDAALLERARQVRHWCRQAGVLFIVNDRPDIARLAHADGVHLGQDDLPVKEARRIVGPDALIGVSTHNLDQLRQAVRDGVSYVGVGPTFTSKTKEFEAFAGLDYVRAAAAETSLPAFVLGGVGPENVDQVIAAGGRRIAVSQSICQAEEPRLVALALKSGVRQEAVGSGQ